MGHQIPEKPHFVIINAVALNTGDAAILYGLQAILADRFPDGVRLTVFDNQPESAQRYHGSFDFRGSLFAGHSESATERRIRRLGYGHWNNRLRALRFRLYFLSRRWHVPLVGRALASARERASLDVYCSADAAVSTGGTYLIEVYSLEDRIRELELALAANLPLILFTQSLGPFSPGPEQKRLRRVMSAAGTVLVRDARSRRHLLDIGVPEERIALAADAAFALAANDTPQTPNDLNSQQRPRIAISVREVRAFLGPHGADAESRFLDGVADLACHAVRRHSAQIVFLSTCQGVPEYAKDDSRTADRIVGRLPPDCRSQVTVDRTYRTPQELCQAYAKHDLLIATRMHAAILALCGGTPVIGLAYEFKLTELFATIGTPELCLPIDPWPSGRAESTLDHLLERRRDYALGVSAAVRRCRHDALMAGRYLGEAVANGRESPPSAG